MFGSGRMNFVHAADLHIDSPVRGLARYPGAPVELAHGATRRALVALVDLCIEERVAFLVLAGDLFDAYERDFKSGLFFVREMMRLRDHGIRVFSVRGNHDADNRLVAALLLPQHVTELGLAGPETVILEDLGVAVHGQSYPHRRATENLARSYPPAVPGLFNLGILHTSADGREGHDDYAPCHLRTLRALGYDYWALGHVHRYEVLSKTPWVVFSGNLQGRSMREPGPKGALLVRVQQGFVASIEYRALDVIRFCSCSVDIEDAGTLDEVLDQCRLALAKTLSQAGDREDRVSAIRLVLRGAPGVGTLLSHVPDRVLSQIRATAMTMAPSGLWIEEVWAETMVPMPTRWVVGQSHHPPP